jgi:hypothetical protein
MTTLRHGHSVNGKAPVTRAVPTLELNNERMTLVQWAKRTGLSQSCIRQRMAAGWTDEKVLLTPFIERSMRSRFRHKEASL